MRKKKLCRRLDGLLPIFQPESRYNELYRDTGQLGAVAGATTRPARGHDTASWAAILLRGHATRSAARVHGLARGELRYKNCIVARGVCLCRNMAWLGCDTAHSSSAIRPGGARHGARHRA